MAGGVSLARETGLARDPWKEPRGAAVLARALVPWETSAMRLPAGSGKFCAPPLPVRRHFGPSCCGEHVEAAALCGLASRRSRWVRRKHDGERCGGDDHMDAYFDGERSSTKPS